MNDEHKELDRLRGLLRDSENLDMVTAAKLRAARARALDAARKPARPWVWAVPAGAMAVLVATLWMPAMQTATAPVPVAGPTLASEALDVLVDEQSPEFYQDLEMYEWLEQQDGGRA